MEMLIHGERDHERMVIHHHMGEGVSHERDEPIDLVGGGNEREGFGQSLNMGDSLLESLIIPSIPDI
jgi:hypothetical protein